MHTIVPPSPEIAVSPLSSQKDGQRNSCIGWGALFVLVGLAVMNLTVWSYISIHSDTAVAERSWFKDVASVHGYDSSSTALHSKPLLTLAMLDIGQGDALYIESPTGNQILIDGGPDAAVLAQLERIMPPRDKDIDVLLITNPDKDHLGGFIDILMRYSVGLMVEPGTITKTRVYAYLKDVAAKHNVPLVRARRGMEFDLGGGAVFSVLYPEGDVSHLSTNDGSMVGVLSFGSTTALLTGDATIAADQKILTEQPALNVDLLKVGHHGSRTSTSRALLEKITPDEAIISAGKDNSYGHPNREITDRLNAYHIPYTVTAQEGTIIYVSDGEHFYRVKK